MPVKRGGLGRGLESLLPCGVSEGRPDFPGFERENGWNQVLEDEQDWSTKLQKNGKGRELYLPLDQIQANPNQPRKHFDETALKELAESIKEHGIIEPVLVEETGDGSYLIIAGERRCRAAALAGLSEVPVLIRAYSEEQRMAVSLIENIQRENLNPIEEASAYRQLMDITGLSQDEVAVKVGKSRPAVANMLRLLKLPEPVREALKSGAITQGHARAVLSVEDETARLRCFHEIIEKKLSVREAETLAGSLNKTGSQTEGTIQAHSRGASSERDPNIAALEQRFIEILGVKVRIDGGTEAGVVHIDYYSTADLDKIYNILEG